MDAHMPVTHKEGDRYPLGPPKLYLGVLSVSRRPTLEVGGRWGGTSHPDQIIVSQVLIDLHASLQN